LSHVWPGPFNRVVLADEISTSLAVDDLVRASWSAA
jgi:hypothetical protein